MKYNKKITKYDKKTMDIFMDGCIYEIDYDVVNILDDKDANLTEKQLLYFSKAVKDFKSQYNFELVYCDEYKYYFVAILDFGEDVEIWDCDELNDIQDDMVHFLKSKRIEFS